jgi:hypothetical protein
MKTRFALTSECVFVALVATAQAASDFSAASCGEALLECQELCALRGGVQDHECWGSTADACVRCECADGRDYTDKLGVTCDSSECGYACPTYQPKPCSYDIEAGCGGAVASQPCCHDSLEVCDFFGGNGTDAAGGSGLMGLCLNLECNKSEIVVSGVPEWQYQPHHQRFDVNGVYRLLSPDSAEYGLDITVQDPVTLEDTEFRFIVYPYKAGGIDMSWTLYCEKGCYDVWLVTSDFSPDIEAVSSWDFAGQGGTGLCSEARDFTCWHDSVDLANISISCGIPARGNDCRVTKHGSTFPGISEGWCNTNCFDDQASGVPVPECLGGPTDLCEC